MNHPQKYSYRTVVLAIGIYAVFSFGVGLAIARYMYLDSPRGALLTLAHVFSSYLSFRIGALLQLRLNSDLENTSHPSFENIATNKETAAIGWEGFDIDDPKYPKELDIALQAWRAVCLNPSEKLPKEQLSEWISTHYPNMPNNAVERIVGVCNWDKTGGRPSRSK